VACAGGTVHARVDAEADWIAAAVVELHRGASAGP
jgi:hypothetical protein